MMTLHLDKEVTAMKELKGGKTMTTSFKYKDLENFIKSENEVIADYPFGSRKRRINNLIKLGFELKETVWFNDEAPYSRIREVWAR